MKKKAHLGFGLGLRVPYYDWVLDTRPAVDWFEVITEDYLLPGGARAVLRAVRKHYPVVLHGVALSIGGVDPLNAEYLQQVRALAHEIEPEWISDHLCFTGAGGVQVHDLLPLPYTEAMLQHVSARLHQAQDILGRALVLENVSSYVSYASDEMSEWEFLAELARRSGCRLLLDVNNVYVSAHNHRFDARKYVDGVPAACVQQYHLAGHSRVGEFLVDTHDAPIIEPVWDLYEYTLEKVGRRAVLIERDDQFPEPEEWMAELNQARAKEEALCNWVN